MRILLTTNKTLSNGKSTWVDGHYYNIYLPLKDLGHEVLFWDTVNDAVQIFGFTRDIEKLGNL